VQADTPLPNPEWYHRLDEQDISLDIIGDSAQVEFRVHARVGSLKVWRQGLCQRANHCVFLSTWPVYALFFSRLIFVRARLRPQGTLSVVTFNDNKLLSRCRCILSSSRGPGHF
jgi:hypothetical protein